MIKNSRVVRKFEADLIRGRRADYAHNVRIVKALYAEARSLGRFSRRRHMEGLEIERRIARVVNSV